MVQRKLGLESDHHHKTQNLFQHHDVKNNKTAALKKKMKKSGSIKRPKPPSRPPPPSPSPPAQSPVVKTATTPNYMKPTTSSDARKEQSQSQSHVSTKNPKTSPHSSNLSRESSDSSKLSLSSGKKATKTLIARTLTKNPTFKPARGSATKCSTIVLCENLDAQRATCSSTLKDCKFPTYLSLNPGGTESEGTSAIKVCPYTYCSLNGHHHAPLPPLKCFLSARRRFIKTQRSIKLGCLSPRRAKPVEDDAPIEEEGEGLFVEIYGKEDEDSDDSAEIGRDSSIEKAAEDQEERVLETLSDAPICDDFDTYEDQVIEVDEEIYPPFLVEEERSMDFLTELPNLDDVEDSEGSDMDWEKGCHSALNLGYDYDYSPATDLEPDPEACIGKNRINIIESESKDWCFDESLVDERSQESYEEIMNSDAFSSSDDSEFSDSDNHLGNSNTMNSPSLNEAQEEESESAQDEKNHISFESSFGNLNDQSLPNEDAIAVTQGQLSNLENSDENIKTLSNIDSGKEPRSEGKADMEDGGLARFAARPKKPIQERHKLGSFNPRDPNFLLLEPDPEAEKVDLKHQDVDEKKNAEEWMVDYALRQVVTKLGPCRKRKVALLVEAFEKVMPINKCDVRLGPSSAFDQARPIQACN